jgi:hypothetical protein
MPSQTGSFSTLTSNSRVTRLLARYSFAILRHTVAISRSRFRTPASFV